MKVKCFNCLDDLLSSNNLGRSGCDIAAIRKDMQSEGLTELDLKRGIHQLCQSTACQFIFEAMDTSSNISVKTPTGYLNFSFDLKDRWILTRFSREKTYGSRLVKTVDDKPLTNWFGEIVPLTFSKNSCDGTELLSIRP